MSRPSSTTEPDSRSGEFPGPDVLEIDVAEAASLRERLPGSFRLIDCREPDEWDLCRIEGAELVPLGTIPECAPVRFADRSQPLLIYCHHGVRSARAAAFLRHQGWPKVWSVAGGIDEWSRRIDPSVPRY